MPDLTPEQIVEKQIKRAQAAVGDYKEGVRNVKESPTAKAALKKDKYLSGVQQAVEDGTYVDGCNSVSREAWIEATESKGGERYAKGVEKSRDKLLDFQTQIKPHRDAVKRQVRAMPNDTQEERYARMDANARGMGEFKYRRKKR